MKSAYKDFVLNALLLLIQLLLNGSKKIMGVRPASDYEAPVSPDGKSQGKLDFKDDDSK